MESNSESTGSVILLMLFSPGKNDHVYLQTQAQPLESSVYSTPSLKTPTSTFLKRLGLSLCYRKQAGLCDQESGHI